MHIIKSIIDIFLEALFPISPKEREVLAIDPKESFNILPRAKNSPILEACGIFSYKDERTRKLIWSIKYKKSAKGSAIAGHAIYRIAKMYSNVVSQIIIVPMPITKKRRRERGFNQCELIANEIKKLDTNNRLVITRDILFRKLHMSRQTLKDRQHRLESAKDIFEADENAIQKLRIDKTSNYLVLVIDDVITTGSTILDAIKTLRKAGLEKTFGLTVAH